MSSPPGDWITKSVNVPPTSNPTRYAMRSGPAFGAREHQAIREPASGLVGDRVLERIAARVEPRPLEHQDRRARPDPEQRGDVPRSQHRVHHLLHDLNGNLERPL